MASVGWMAPASAQAVSHTGPTTATATGVAWGDSFDGRLGDGTLNERRVPTMIKGLTGDLFRIYPGAVHNFALRYDGLAFAWGSNDYGELGDGTRTRRLSAVPVTGLSAVTQLAAGEGHSLALRSDGTVWAWGDNQFGQLGDGTKTSHLTPAQVPTLTNIVQVAAAYYHSFALRSDGSVWAWGNGGQLGTGNDNDSTTPVLVPGLPFITQLSAARFHTLALALNTQVYAWGFNHFGTLGDGTTSLRLSPVAVAGLAFVKQVSAGLLHSVALRENGTVASWGYNGDGQLGDGTIAAVSRLVPADVPGLAGVTQVAAGWHYTLALRSDGTVRAWGNNEFGQLGDGTDQTRGVPAIVPTFTQVIYIASGAYHNVAVTLAAPDFALILNPSAGTVTAGQSIATTVSTAVLSGFARPVALTVSGLPAGVTASKSAEKVSPGYPSTITLTTFSTALSGSFTITITGTVGAEVRSATYVLTIVDGGEFGCESGNHADVAIPDNGPAVTSTILLVGCDLAHAPTSVSVTVSIVHPRRGDLDVDLTSPDGVTYPLKESDPTDLTANLDATFLVDLTGAGMFNAAAATPTSNAWVLQVRDTAVGSTGTLTSWNIQL